ncbi:hypothetical protein LZF95_00455 [Algoriphagus sp. AGSA1]|uniref:hypothetical protein n=1 Tax=Algoriphagus sp. AGSA1 TaxID=2907213 RepID=UPI001F37ABA3|nr:hypothetical protein [Algoriphagus sp. AGSA1]MCE7053124.1 hypothetical protein [Algoriphagus sp. AGSA1]
MNTFYKTYPSKFKCKSHEHCKEVLYDLLISMMNIDSWKNTIMRIFKNALSGKPDYKGLTPGDHAYFGNEFLKLIYSAHYLYENCYLEPVDAPCLEDLVPHRELASSPNLSEYIYLLPSRLDIQEIRNPWIVLKRFFLKKSLKKWVKKWNEMRDYAICNFSGAEENAEDFMEHSEDFIRLTEACYIIYTRLFDHSKTKTS